MSQSVVKISQPCDTVRVTLPDNLVLEAPVGTTIEEFLRAHCEQVPDYYTSPFIAAIFDSKLRELAYPVKRDADLEPVLLSHSDGGRIYRRSLVLLLVTAIDELWPGTVVNVSYAVPDGGFYCLLPHRAPFTEEELERLEAHMHAIAAEDNPITKRTVSLEEAISLFSERGDEDKVRLLEQRTRNGLVLYTLRNRSDYYFGYMVPSTGYLKYFRLVKMPNGFILQYPTREDTTLPEIIPNTTKIGAVFEEAEEWLQRIGVEDIGRLNQIVRQDRIQELILVNEALHEQQI